MDTDTERKTIFVVDDEDINLDLMQGILEVDYQVQCFLRGEDCLKAYEEKSADLVLLDVKMPELDGLEVCRRLIELDSNCPVMFVSGKSSNEERLAGYNAGGYDYIVKPFDAQELQAKIAIIIQQQTEYQQLDNTRKQIFEGFMEAATGSGEQGVLLQFASVVLRVRNYKDLAELVLNTMNQLGELKASVIINGQKQSLSWSSNGPCPPMEEEVLLMLKDKGRIFRFNNRIQVNEENISVLIKNMPEDEKISGRMIDHIPLLLQIASSCINNIDTSENLTSSLKSFEIVQSVCNKLVECEKELLQSMYQFTSHTEDEFVRMQNDVQYLALSEEHEDKLLASFKLGLDQARKSQDDTNEVCTQFGTIINELKTLL